MNLLYRIASRPAYLVTLCVATVVTIFLIIWWVLPEPPKTLTIATGFPEGLYHQFAKQLQSELAKEKITLRIQNTGGSMDNLSLLSEQNSGVDLAIVQSGVGDPTQYPKLTALAGLFFEPLWVWYRPAAFSKEGGTLQHLSQLKGKKVSIGNRGSGTAVLSQAILTLNAIEPTQLRLLSLTPDEAIQQLRQGEIDVAMIVLAGEAPILKDFYRVPGIRLMDFDQAEAYTRILPYLNRVEIPRGLVSIAHDLPKENIHVIAPTATLVARSDINPATVSLLLGASYDILRNYSRLQKPGEFPSGKGLDFPIDLDAEIFLKDGPSFFYRHLPFWGAVWLERVIKILIPLLLIVLPLVTYLPAILNLSLKIRLGRLYKTLKNIETRFTSSTKAESLFSELDDLEKRIERLNISALHSKALYDLRMHIALVRDQLKQAK